MLQEEDGSLPVDYKLLGEKLSEKFDSVRVDLFNCNNRVYFGELTHYDASGMGRYEPELFDFEMGSHWKAQRNYLLDQ